MIKTSLKNNGKATEHVHFLSPFKIIIALLFLSLTIYVLSLANYTIISADNYYTGTITVAGHGEVEMKPDIQKLLVEVSPDAVSSNNSTSTPKVATSSVEYVKKVVAYLKSKGFSPSDIKISPPNTIAVKIRGENLDNSKRIANDIEKISEKRITTTLSIPEVENPDQLKSRVLEMALDNAKMNAFKVSQSLGADLGKVLSFNDNSYYSSSDNAYNDNYNPALITADVSVSYEAR